ncbi:MAG: flagellar basal body L-ring protein FlgH [Sulfurospirillum sp.]|nr:MAG: flagellar basal body L-ring protein FlgH [Sulfurospirillum sp.]
MYFIFTALIILFISGCSKHMASPSLDISPPEYVLNPQVSVPSRCNAHAGSIFGRGQNPIFSDRKAMHVNDIITVIIDESATQISNGNKKITTNSQNNMGGGVFSGGILKGLNGVTDIGFKTNTNSTYNGSGSASRKEKFSTTISARVVKILPNGNYFIAGSRELLLNGVKQIVKVSGVVRSYDIDEHNTIDSKYIADAKIIYETEGDIRESMRKPWGTKAVESVWPF